MRAKKAGSGPPPHLAAISMLDWIRPGAGWVTKRAILSTYSANSAVIIAALLALAGQENEAGSGSRIGLAKALFQLRGKVQVVLQAGQLALPRRPSRILSLTDRFIVQVQWDQGSKGLHKGRSWHPKFALVQHVHEEAEKSRWIFILSSRNLTRDTSWDLSLVLEAAADDAAGQVVPGIGAIAKQLAGVDDALGTWATQERELSRLRWAVPEGLSVEEIRLMLSDGTDRGLPAPPAETSRLLAVSPFLDASVTSELSDWCADTQLLSIRASLQNLHAQSGVPLKNWKSLMVMSESDREPEDEEATKEGEDPKLLEPDNRGLHAKFLYVQHTGGPTLWLGSANLTDRAWRRNAEIVARVRVTDPKSAAAKVLVDGIRRFVDEANPIEQAELGAPDPLDTDREALDEARRQVSARLTSGKQCQPGEFARVECTAAPHPDDPRVELQIGRIGDPLKPWPRGSTACELPALNAAESVDSGLLHIALRLGNLTEEWLQVLPWIPALSEARDDLALRHYLGAKHTLLWIREMLTDLPSGDDGGPWDGDRKRRHPNRPGGRDNLELPSIESFLRIWIKDRKRLGNQKASEIDRILVIAESIAAGGDDPAEREALQHLNSFKKTWKTVRKGLARVGADGR